jgi:hypothetical protein
LGINVAQLTAAQWRGPWFRAPLLNTLALPVAWALIAPMSSLILLMASSIWRQGAPNVWHFLFLSLAIVIGWVLLLTFVTQRFGSREGLWLALMLHVVLLAYALGSVGVLSMIVKLVADLTSAPALAIFDAIVLAVCIAAIVGARLGERFVAFRCIRRYLRLRAAGDTMPT